MGSCELVNSLKSLGHKFLWLNLNPEAGYPIKQSYGFLGRIIDDQYIKFYPVNNECKVYSEFLISISDIQGFFWSGPYIDRFRLAANYQNLKVNPDTLAQKEELINNLPKANTFNEIFSKHLESVNELENVDQYLKELHNYLEG